MVTHYGTAKMISENYEKIHDKSDAITNNFQILDPEAPGTGIGISKLIARQRHTRKDLWGPMSNISRESEAAESVEQIRHGMGNFLHSNAERIEHVRCSIDGHLIHKKED